MRLIDADALTDVIERTDWYHLSEIGTMVHGAVSGDNAWYREGDIFKAIEEAPTIDAVPVVHGEWVHPKGYVVSNGFVCSKCGHEEASHYPINPRPGGCCIADEHGNFFHPPNINYCPNCGADMRERKDGDTDG